MPGYEDVLLTIQDGVATITLNRPERMNAFRLQTVDELLDAFQRAQDDRGIGVIVLTGAGDRAFCAGGDMSWENGSDQSEALRMSRQQVALATVMRNCGKPVIARVDGWAVGGGNELQLLCDLTVASESSRFGQAGPKMGSVPVWWGTQLLPQLVGEKRAREIVMLCQHYSAQQALEMGWINRVVPGDELDAAVDEWSQRLLSFSPQSLRVAKLSLNYGSDHMWPSVFHGFELISFIHETEEFHEGTQAFIDKRPADFAKFRR